MTHIETSRHLYQPPVYKRITGDWSESYSETINGNKNLTIDNISIASILSFGQVSQDRTLFEEVKRLPWLSTFEPNGLYHLEELPKHGFFTGPTELISSFLFKKLCSEARTVINNYSNIFILLTGGLDSRIIAGVFEYLFKSGELNQKPTCLTWGISNSRDVEYAREIAATLGFEWNHIPLDKNTVITNIEKAGDLTGLLHSPEMLHSMLWFENLSRDSIVIAGSFGDSIGRAEFSNLHLLQLSHKNPNNFFNLLSTEDYVVANKGLLKDINEIHKRGGEDTLTYMQCEYWMQGYRMRNGLCNALATINQYCRVYQMYTAPEVYSFMWSLHPACRNNEIYFDLLKRFFPRLAEIPWARTNKSILGKSGLNGLKQHYHDYTKWSRDDLNKYISNLVDPDWFENKRIFNPASIAKMNHIIRRSNERVGRINDVWLWLAGFRHYIDRLDNNGFKIEFISSSSSINTNLRRHFMVNPLVLLASNSSVLNQGFKVGREILREKNLSILKKKMLVEYPPKKIL